LLLSNNVISDETACYNYLNDLTNTFNHYFPICGNFNQTSGCPCSQDYINNLTCAYNCHTKYNQSVDNPQNEVAHCNENGNTDTNYVPLKVPTNPSCPDNLLNDQGNSQNHSGIPIWSWLNPAYNPNNPRPVTQYVPPPPDTVAVVPARLTNYNYSNDQTFVATNYGYGFDRVTRESA
ncbi:25359_t:CDS:2, partial [Dentiscutata erythropus]